MVRFQISSDDELDAALILSGWMTFNSLGRHCFQTTYLNNSYLEYFEHNDYKLIWVLRNPASVIYSMLYNWNRGALNRLFHHCGSTHLDEKEFARYQRFGALMIPKLVRACLSYNAKLSQIFEIHKRLEKERIYIIDYDALTKNKDRILPEIYGHINLPYKSEYADKLHSSSIDKADSFYIKNRGLIDGLCKPIYEQARELLR
jgi:hypothetical protein